MSASLIDKAKKPREGEELDVAKLEPYLLERIPGSRGPLVVEQFPSGHSNLTYLLKLGDKEYVLRRPPFGSKVKSAHDMGREYRVLSKLHPAYPPAPQVLLYCDHYDPHSEKYSMVVMNVLRVAGVATVLMIVGFIGVMWLRDRRKLKTAAATPHPGQSLAQTRFPNSRKSRRHGRFRSFDRLPACAIIAA